MAPGSRMSAYTGTYERNESDDVIVVGDDGAYDLSPSTDTHTTHGHTHGPARTRPVSSSTPPCDVAPAGAEEKSEARVQDEAPHSTTHEECADERCVV